MRGQNARSSVRGNRRQIGMRVENLEFDFMWRTTQSSYGSTTTIYFLVLVQLRAVRILQQCDNLVSALGLVDGKAVSRDFDANYRVPRVPRLTSVLSWRISTAMRPYFWKYGLEREGQVLRCRVPKTFLDPVARPLCTYNVSALAIPTKLLAHAHFANMLDLTSLRKVIYA